MGFTADIYKDGTKIGETRHDGDAIFYTVSIRDTEAFKSFIDWAGEIAPLTIWNPADFDDHGIEDNRIGLLETAGVEFMLTEYEKAVLA